MFQTDSVSSKDLSIFCLDSDFKNVCGKEYTIDKKSSTITDGHSFYSLINKKKKVEIPVIPKFAFILDPRFLDLRKSLLSVPLSSRKSYRNKKKTLVFVEAGGKKHLCFLNRYFYGGFRRKRAYMQRNQTIRPNIDFSRVFLNNKDLHLRLLVLWFRIFFKRHIYTMRGIPLRYFFYIRIYLAKHVGMIQYIHFLNHGKSLNIKKKSLNNGLILDYFLFNFRLFKPFLENLFIFCLNTHRSSWNKFPNKANFVKGQLLRRNRKKNNFREPIKQIFG